jgi:outer membrane biosynthesis protein TonB
MSVNRHFVLLALVLSLGTSGCSWFKRRKPAVPQAQAPTVTQPQPAEPPPAATAEPPPAEPAKPAETAAAKPKPKPKPAHPVKKVVVPPPKPEETTTAATVPPPRVAIQESAPANQISSAMPHDQATDSKRTTQQLLDSTDANLRALRRALNADEKSMLEQIRAYQQQARAADQEGDLVRAHNLALKAHLLSDELVKR